MYEKLCVSIGGNRLKDFEEKALQSEARLVELRLDTFPKLQKEMGAVRILVQSLSSQMDIILTVKSKNEKGFFEGSEANRVAVLKELASCCPKYIDIELESHSVKEIIEICTRVGVKTVVSKHDFSKTPSLRRLTSYVEKAIDFGASIVKIVTYAKSHEDNLVMLKLDSVFQGRTVGFCMGEIGVPSRILAPFFGSPFTYASFEKESLAPGQLSAKDVMKIWSMMGILQ